MSRLSSYNIAFKGLSLGRHEFLFELDKNFFEIFENSIVEDGKVQVKLTLEKQSALMILWFQVSGTVDIPCDRCLDMYSQPIRSKNRIIVKLGEENIDEGDDVIWVSVNDYQLNVAQLMYEFVSLSLPIKRVHPNDATGKSTCNPEMIKRLNSMNVASDESEGQTSDTRWDDLKKLLGNE